MWLAEKAERERQIREWYTTTYVPGQQAAGSTEIRPVDYFLGLYGGTDTRGSWAKIGEDLTFRHPPEPVSTYSNAMPPGGFRLAIVNCFDLAAGRAARDKLRAHFLESRE